MVWYFIGVYIINRTLHGRLEIRNFSSRVEKIFHSFAALTREIFFQHSKRNFVSPCGHVISSISLRVSVLSTKVLIEDTIFFTCEYHFTSSSGQRKGLAVCRAKAVP